MCAENLNKKSDTDMLYNHLEYTVKEKIELDINFFKSKIFESDGFNFNITMNYGMPQADTPEMNKLIDNVKKWLNTRGYVNNQQNVMNNQQNVMNNQQEISVLVTMYNHNGLTFVFKNIQSTEGGRCLRH